MSKSQWDWDSAGDWIQLLDQNGGIFIEVLVDDKTRTATERKLAKLASAMNMHEGFLETCAKARGDLAAWVCQEEGKDEDLIGRIKDRADEVYDNLRELFKLLESILDENAEAVT